MVALSVLDLSPVTTGGSGAAALRNSIDLARLADRLGCRAPPRVGAQNGRLRRSFKMRLVELARRF
jgi:hypothetical protein